MRLQLPLRVGARACDHLIGLVLGPGGSVRPVHAGDGLDLSSSGAAFRYCPFCGVDLEARKHQDPPARLAWAK